MIKLCHKRAYAVKQEVDSAGQSQGQIKHRGIIFLFNFFFLHQRLRKTGLDEGIGNGDKDADDTYRPHLFRIQNPKEKQGENQLYALVGNLL